MNADSITKENVVFFFNKYKYNSDLIFHLERRILKESYDYKKWEAQRAANSELTRSIFRENQKLIEEFIQPAIRNPEQLCLEALQAYLLHTTFFLFENNLDTYVVDDLINSILKRKDILNEHLLFSGYMNLGISRTLLVTGTFEETLEYFEKALSIFPTQESCGDDTTRVHQVFCRVYEMLAFCLYKSNDFRRFVEIYERASSFLRDSSDELCEKMWGNGCDGKFHIEYLIRYFRIYGIFTAGQRDFSVEGHDTEANRKALEVIKGWLIAEYKEEEKEGEINLMIFTYYHLMRFKSGDIRAYKLEEIYSERFNEYLNLPDSEKQMIYADLAFPDDGDPVDPKFSRMLDKMKLFNRSFSYNYIFLYNFVKISHDKKHIKKIIQQMVSFYEQCRYAEKGFSTDRFVIDTIKIVARKMENEKGFMLFIQSIFMHRQISSSIHFGMVSSLAGICLYHIIQEKPELSIVPGLFSTRQDVIENRTELLHLIKNAALLHDIGKIGVTHIINLQFRPITKSEYERIKSHSELGKEIIDGIDFLSQYQDFVEGHHKFWNDEGGYPESYRVHSSPYKVLVNLVSICDMIDTTTDTMGRNYSIPKTFDEVMDELRKGSGTRYCPEIVEVILNSKELQKEIKSILSLGRSLNSFKTYQNFVLPNMSFSSADERHIIQYKPEFKVKVAEFYRNTFEDSSEELISEHLNEFLDAHNSRVFIMQDKNDTVFAIFVGHVVTPLTGEEKFCIVDEVIVRKGYRRLGYGMEMMMYANARFKEEGVAKMKVSICNDFSSETFFWISGFSQSNQYLMEKRV